jgi:hypothetical protein
MSATAHTETPVEQVDKPRAKRAPKPPLERIAYSFEETAQQIGRHRCWVYRQVKAGRIRAITGFGVAMIPASEIKRIMEGRPA